MNNSPNTPPQPKPLYRSATNKRLAGVCGGIADYFSLDATVVRLAWIAITVLSGVLPGVIAYIIAAMVMPEQPQVPPTDATGTTV